MQPQNRLRSGASSVICSRCTSMLSMNHSRMTSRYTSQASLSHMPSHKKAPPTKDTMPKPESEVEPPILCKICLIDCPVKETYRIQQCKCIFCTEVSPIFSWSQFGLMVFTSLSSVSSNTLLLRSWLAPTKSVVQIQHVKRRASSNFSKSKL